MRAYIYTGGEINKEGITEHPRGNDMVLAADSGWHNALSLGEHPQILVGDFDSFGKAELPKDVELITLPCEKDVTDTQAVVELAIERGADEIVIVGGLSGRLDHTLSNLGILEDMHARGVHAVITDGCNRVRYLKNGSTLIGRGAFTYLSLLAADATVKGVTVEGCKYPLKNARLSRAHQFAVSNELLGNCALISVRRGGVYIIESMDRCCGK